MNNTTTQEGKNKISSILKRVTRHEKLIEITGSLIAIVVALYPIINYVYNFSYQKDCEQFYNVPGKYFCGNIGENILFVGLLIVLMLFAVVPAIMRKQEIKNGIETKASLTYIIFLTIALGFSVGVVNACSLEIIMERTNNSVINNFINAHAMPIVICITVMFIISLLCIVLMKEIKDIKYKAIKMAIIVVFSISTFVSAMLMIYGTMFKLGTESKDITKYEFAEKDNQHYIVVSDYNDKKVVMKYYEDNGIFYIDTDKYYFIDDQAVFSYKDLDVPPKRANID